MEALPSALAALRSVAGDSSVAMGVITQIRKVATLPHYDLVKRVRIDLLRLEKLAHEKVWGAVHRPIVLALSKFCVVFHVLLMQRIYLRW